MIPKSNLLVGLIAVVPHVACLQAWLHSPHEIDLATGIDDGNIEADGAPTLAHGGHSSVLISVAAEGDLAGMEPTLLGVAPNASGPMTGMASRKAGKGEHLSSSSLKSSPEESTPLKSVHGASIRLNGVPSSAQASSKDEDEADEDEADKDEGTNSLSMEGAHKKNVELLMFNAGGSTGMKAANKEKLDSKTNNKLGTGDWGPIVGLSLVCIMGFFLVTVLIPSTCVSSPCCRPKKSYPETTKSPPTIPVRFPRRVPVPTPTSPHTPVETDPRRPVDILT
uniref:Transmembrane protein n=1 Tax=Lotharella globosa TaxID=91324 RepID=A0A7S4DY15_9EUKA|mmetsp:Transcript_4061/g.8099  ORF Transcript_4061/g.8099 Transcript_4061/m.8099 type:complete len:280 (-) Transcript_4061:153-992(-)